jgi:GT2 family glycosyltransferase
MVSRQPVRRERVYVIVVNWNGWRDTIECLESLFRLDYPDYKVVVCDNASTDGSWDQIQGWAQGSSSAEARNAALSPLISPPIQKPIPFAQVHPDSRNDGTQLNCSLFLIQTGANLGFAGGNNVGLKYALNRGDCDFAWLLNNDTVVRPDALSCLVRRMQERPDAGICGSTLVYYDNPSKVQAWAGCDYNRWFARGGNLGNFTDAATLPEADAVERQLGYVVGASMLVRKAFLDQIGLMNEQYFLTFEEIDWATRAKGRFTLAYAPSSVVYHREGGATGSHRMRSRRSPLSEFYTIRGRVLFTRNYYPFALASVLCAIGLSAGYRLVGRRWANLGALLRGVFEGFMLPTAAGRNLP